MCDDIIHQGFCNKQGAVVTNWKRRYFVLRKDGYIYYFKPNRNNDYSTAKNKGVIRDFVDVLTGDSCHLGNDWPRDAPASCRFSLPCPSLDRTYHIYCDNATEADRWISALTAVAKRRAKLRELGIA
eukprot:m.135438 g.135438  ORF g.135438 m.135438 type:complete len:127 (-) comp15993_c0_seq2:3333-3713(-)